MNYLNKANGQEFDHFTARQIAHLSVEGVDIWTTPKAWRRINKRLRKMGLYSAVEPARLTELSSLEVEVAIEEADNWVSEQVDSFLEDMYIMGMLEEEEEDE